MAILFSNASYAEESEGAICEKNGRSWLWNGNLNQWECKKIQPRESYFEILKRGCDRGDNVKCGSLGVLYVEGKDLDGTSNPQDVGLGLMLVKQSCGAGNLNACNEMARYYRYGKYIGENKYKAAQIFQLVCDAGERGSLFSPSGYACYYLGIMTEKGEGIPKNKSKAKELYNKACGLEVDLGCEFARDLK